MFYKLKSVVVFLKFIMHREIISAYAKELWDTVPSHTDTETSVFSPGFLYGKGLK